MTPIPTASSQSSTPLSFFQYFANLRDPRRQGRTTFGFLDLLFICLVATIAGAEDCKAIALFARERRSWLQKFCRLPIDPDSQDILTPSHDTFERLLKRLDPVRFGRCFGRWTTALASRLGLKQIAIDGKCLRGSGRLDDGFKALHLVGAWATENQLSLGQVAVDDKSNEITAIPVLLKLLDLEGALVTIDAMGCQKDIAEQIVAGGGDYVLPVKGNQATLLGEIEFTFEMAMLEGFETGPLDCFQTQERGHGRFEKRTYYVLHNVDFIGEKDKWDGLSVIGWCIYEREEKGKLSREDHYFMGSRLMNAQGYAAALRGHWGIENNLHWQLDVSFGEDANRVAERNTAENLASIRRHALSLLKRHPAKLSIDKKRYKATLSESFLEEVVQLG
jgi:predicted transposase YbfD/YdcC